MKKKMIIYNVCAGIFLLAYFIYYTIKLYQQFQGMIPVVNHSITYYNVKGIITTYIFLIMILAIPDILYYTNSSK